MRRGRIALLLTVLLASAPAVPLVADHEAESSPPDPMHRVNAIVPKPPGTLETVVLQYGPYLVHPGSDLSRVDYETSFTDGFVIAARPAVRYADGTEPPDDVVHIHHAHWVRIKEPQEWPQPYTFDYNDYLDWFFGTGEEKTRGHLRPVWEADARSASGLRYGGVTRRGDRLAFVSMLHNKGASALTVWLEGRFEFVHGTRQQLAALGLDYRGLRPTLHGTTFQVPRTGGIFTWPRDLSGGPSSWIASNTPSGRLVPGVGHVWKAPFSGTIVIGAGHLHPGGREVVVSNLGSVASPCGGGAFLSDPDADAFAGRTILRVKAYYQTDPSGKEIFPAEGFQMGITQHAWRAKVRAGDIIAINGVYDATDYAYPDAMSFFGFYTDTSEPPGPSEACWSGLIGPSNLDPPSDVLSMPNRAWDAYKGDFCTQPCGDLAGAKPKGEHLATVSVAGFVYAPGDYALPVAAPWVRRGETIRFVNEDWALGLVRHSVTSCAWPCNGPYALNYPFHDGAFDSGAMGFTPIDTYQVATQIPEWTLDTSGLAEGPHAYYCRLHTWMRGAFYVEPAA